MAFPTTGLVDQFNRANEGPPPSANWTTSTGLNGLQVDTNQVRSSSGTSFGFWNAATFGPDSECYCTIPTKGANTQLCAVYVRLKDDSSFATLDGYTAFFTVVSGGNNDTITVQRIDNGVGTNLGSTITQEFSSGDALGMDMVVSTINVYYKSGAGAWTNVGNRSDSTYADAGHIGLAIAGTTYRVDDFGGGTRIASIAFEPIVRRIVAVITQSLAFLSTLSTFTF